MLPRDFLRENAARLAAEMPERFADAGLEQFAELDKLRRQTITRLEEKRRRRNELAAVRGKPSPETLAEMKSLKEDIRLLEEEEEHDSQALSAVERRIPNVPHDSVPRGKDETANRPEGTWGRRWASWISSAAPSSPVLALPCSGERERACRERSWSSCSTCTRASTATPRSFPPFSPTAILSSGPDSSRSSKRISSRPGRATT